MAGTGSVQAGHQFDEGKMKRLIEFINVYRMYRLGHSPAYAARIAYDIAFRGCPF